MFCQKCGTQMADDATFCPNCGHQVGEVKANSQAGNPVADSNQAVSKTMNSADGKKKMKIALIAIVVVGALLILFKLLGGLKGVTGQNKFKQCPDLEVIASVMADGHGYIAVKNNGDQTIKDFEIAYVGYDASGNLIKLGYDKDYDTSNFSSANILPGTTYGIDKSIYIGKKDVRYIDVVIDKVIYKDDSEWSTEGLEDWAKDASSAFSVDEYKRSIENMKSDSILAETNPFIEILHSRKYDDNKYSNEDDFDLEAKNIGDQVIKNFSLIVAEYDGNGYGIGARFSFVTENTKLANVDPANLVPGDSEGWNWSLFFDAECSSYKLIVYEIEFKDGTIWTNEHALQWMLYNQDER